MGKNITVIREEWRKLKTTHEKVLKAKKVKFDKSLGEELDKILGSSEKSKEAAQKAIKIIDVYLKRVTALPDPEKTEFTKKLSGLKEYCNAMLRL